MNNEIIEMLPIPKAAELINVSPYRIRKWCIDGTLPCHRAGARYMISTAVLKQFMNNPNAFKSTKDERDLTDKVGTNTHTENKPIVKTITQALTSLKTLQEEISYMQKRMDNVQREMEIIIKWLEKTK